MLKHCHKGHQKSRGRGCDQSREGGESLEEKESTVQDRSHLNQAGSSSSGRTPCTSFLATEKVLALSEGLFTRFRVVGATSGQVQGRRGDGGEPARGAAGRGQVRDRGPGTGPLTGPNAGVHCPRESCRPSRLPAPPARPLARPAGPRRARSRPRLPERSPAPGCAGR